MSFLDLTADGDQPPHGRDPLPLGYLKANADLFQRAHDLPGSRRATLLDLIRQEAWDDFIARLTDLPNPPLWEFATGKAGEDIGAKTVRDALYTKDADAKRAEVRRALDVARHWNDGLRKKEDQ